MFNGMTLMSLECVALIAHGMIGETNEMQMRTEHLAQGQRTRQRNLVAIGLIHDSEDVCDLHWNMVPMTAKVPVYRTLLIASAPLHVVFEQLPGGQYEGKKQKQHYHNAPVQKCLITHGGYFSRSSSLK